MLQRVRVHGYTLHILVVSYSYSKFVKHNVGEASTTTADDLKPYVTCTRAGCTRIRCIIQRVHKPRWVRDSMRWRCISMRAHTANWSCPCNNTGGSLRCRAGNRIPRVCQIASLHNWKSRYTHAISLPSLLRELFRNSRNYLARYSRCTGNLTLNMVARFRIRLEERK